MLGLNTPRPMAMSLRVLAALLGYPDAQLRSHLSEMSHLLRDDRALSESRRVELDALMESLRSADPFDAESDYVELFDRGRATSLHLFEHVHGDSRDRGPAMIDLGQTYEKAGLKGPAFQTLCERTKVGEQPGLHRKFQFSSGLQTPQ